MYTNWDLERAAILELQREHEYLRRVYKVRLRPITIVLSDFKSRWGQYDRTNRTIAIARRLVLEFKWDQVIGVFRHEVAHQLVDEEGPRASDSAPHGEAFRAACRRLGLSAAFARAGLDLELNPPDWRLEPHAPEVERILDRVKKLLALATSGNEHEAVLAMARVRELYGKYNLEQGAQLNQTDFVHLVVDEGKLRRASWEHAKLALIAEHFFVRVLTFAQYQAQTGKRTQAVEIIGTRENVLMAEYVYYFLHRQVESLLRHATQAEGLARHERGSYRLGVLHGFGQKLKLGEGPEAAPVLSQALTAFRGDVRMDAYLAQIHPRLTSRRLGAISVEGAAYADGQRAGRQLNLNRPLTTTGLAGRQITGKL